MFFSKFCGRLAAAAVRFWSVLNRGHVLAVLVLIRGFLAGAPVLIVEAALILVAAVLDCLRRAVFGGRTIQDLDLHLLLLFGRVSLRDGLLCLL